MIGEMIKIEELIGREAEQDRGRVARIAAAMLPIEDIDWDEQPAIVVDEAGNVLDGHHRLAAARQIGLPAWRALRVDAARWVALCESLGFAGACRAVADEAGDAITWGAI